jgi:WD40 repeat protein
MVTVGIDHLLRAWSLDAMSPYYQVADHSAAIRRIAYARDGKTLATAGDDGSIRIWHTDPLALAGGAIPGTWGSALAIVFSPDGRTLAAGYHDGSIRLWNGSTHRQVGAALIGHRDEVAALSFSSDGRRLVSASKDRTIRIWTTKTGVADGAPLSGDDPFVGVDVSADGTTVTSVDVKGAMFTWDLSSRRLSTGLPFSGDTDAATTAFAVAPTGRTLATTGYGGTVRLWDAGRQRIIGQPLESSDKPLLALAFSPDGRLVAAAGVGGLIQLWDTVLRRPIGEPFGDPDNSVDALTFNPSGRALAVGSYEGALSFWNTIPYLDPARTICAQAGPLTRAEWEQYAVTGPMPKTC